MSQLRDQLDARCWIDGNQTSGAMATTRKRNQQLDKDDSVAIRIGELIMERLLAIHYLYRRPCHYSFILPYLTVIKAEKLLVIILIMQFARLLMG